MKKRKTWRDALTKKELKHLKEVGGVTTKYTLEKMFKHQVELRLKHEAHEPCYDCKAIARKLGYEV